MYGIKDGMKSAECNGGSFPSSITTHDGKIIFPTIKGFVEIEPSIMQKEFPQPPTYIERIISENDTITTNETTVLPLGNRKIGRAHV